MINKNFWKKKKVLVTGHTGFKGGWLSLWMKTLGAEVAGYSLDPITKKNFSLSIIKSNEIWHKSI
jgi:CDP-glucose 4,6-dehydratase